MIQRPSPLRLLPGILLLGVPLASISVSAQEPTPAGTGSHVADGGGARNAADRRVTALDVFFACRSLEAFSDTPLRRFCTLPLPAGGPDSVLSVALRWDTTTVPGSLLQLSEQMQNRLRARASNFSGPSTELGPDLSDGRISSTGEAPTEEMIALVAAQVTALRTNEVIIVSPEGDAVAQQYVTRITDVLRPLLLSGVDLTPQREPGRSGVITIHARVPVIAPTEIVSLQAIRFASANADPDAALLSTAAEEIQQHAAWSRGAYVLVVGHRDPGDTDDALATRRAEALRSGLVQFGIHAARIRTTTAEALAVPSSGAPTTSFGRFNIQGVAINAPNASVFHVTRRPEGAAPGGWEGIAMAATDAIMERAEREVQTYVFQTFARRLCKQASGTLVETCTLMGNGGDRQDLPSFVSLQATLRRDLEALPEDLTRWSMVRQASLDDDVAMRQRNTRIAAASLQAFGSVRRIERGEDVATILSEIGGSLPANAVDNPHLVNAHRFASFIKASTVAASELRTVTTGAVPQDTVLKYALLTARANQDTAGFVRALPWLVSAARDVQRAVTDLQSLRQQIDTLRATGETARQARQDLLGTALARMVQLGTIAFTGPVDSGIPVPKALAQEPMPRDSIAKLTEPLGRLLFAVRAQRHTDVLTETLTLLRAFTSPTELNSDASIRDRMRVLTLAADISAAESQADMREAMSRFVSQGGTYATKRRADHRVLYLNAHPGGGWEDAGFGLRLPISLEYVVLPGRDLVVSALFQAIDLGGFIPRSNDSVDRSGDQRLASVFTPGAYAAFTGGNLPVVLGIGVTHRQVHDGERWAGRTGFSAFFGVDVPLLRLR